jgi:RNA polymerase sigma factor (sigma-70 family)
MAIWGGDARYLALVERHGTALLHLAIFLTGNRHDAEDVVQDTLIAVASKPTRAHTLPYLRKAVSNRAMDVLRRRREIPSDTVPEVEFTDVGFFRFEREQRFFALVADLPAGQRATLVLRYFADLDDRSIANILGCSVETVRSQASRGLAKLRASDIVTQEGRS